MICGCCCCVCCQAAVELMTGWAAISTADALELLSPVFRNEEVRAHAVSVLQRKDLEELLSYLLQLVQVGDALSILMHTCFSVTAR